MEVGCCSGYIEFVDAALAAAEDAGVCYAEGGLLGEGQGGESEEEGEWKEVHLGRGEGELEISIDTSLQDGAVLDSIYLVVDACPSPARSRSSVGYRD